MNFSPKKLINSDWSHLYAIEDVNKAVNYFNKRLKRMYNKAFPFVSVNNTKHKNNPWLTSGILKSIKPKISYSYKQNLKMLSDLIMLNIKIN